MAWRTRRECPLCGSENISAYRAATFEIDALKPEDFRITDNRYGRHWSLSRCSECTLVFANPSLDEKDLAILYSGLNDREYSQESENRAKSFKAILRRLDRYSVPDKTLVDIGAASGIFLDLARKRGYSVIGIEPSASLAAEAASRYGLDLFCGTLKNFPMDRNFSVVSLLDIIEHLADPVRMMEKITTLVKPGGVMVIVTPDIGSLTARLAGRRWWHFRIAHVQFFNRRSLSYLLEKHGFSIISIRRYAWNFSFYYLISRLIPRLKGDGPLQKRLKKLNLKLQLFDSLEVYARKR